MNISTCRECGKPINAARNKQAKYCDHRCKTAWFRRTYASTPKKPKAKP